MLHLLSCPTTRRCQAKALGAVLGSLLSVLLVLAGSARAQTPTPMPQGTVAAVAFDGSCPPPNAAALAATASAESPYYDYVVLLDVSGSMAGWYGNPAVYVPEKDIFAAVKESLKGYVRDLQPGSMVYVIPFGNEIDPGRVGQFGIDEPSAADGGVAEALTYIDSLQADNDETHITESVQYALAMLAGLRNDDEREHIQTILLYTDGLGNGPGDLNASNEFVVDNLIGALREFRQEQPYLFVKYVSLGVEVPGREVLEQNGVEVVEQAEGVPPVREVRLAVIPDSLGAIAPGVAVSNRLCAAAGELGDGVTVFVNDDPAALPPNVQVAFRAGGTTLDDVGIPLTYTLASLPGAESGPFTTHVEVRSEDPAVFLVPSRLPVTFSAAAPTPTPEPTATPSPVPPTPTPTPGATLSVGEFSAQSVVRGDDRGAVTWSLSFDLAARNGGTVWLRVDPARLAPTLPGASVGFRTGEDALADEVVLDAARTRTELILSAAQDELETLGDGDHSLPLDVIVDPAGTELSIQGTTAEPNQDGTSTMALLAPLVVRPAPRCTVAIGEALTPAVTVGEASTEPVRWEFVVDLDGSGGCEGEVSLDDAVLRTMIDGARAMFLDNGEERASLYLGDNRFRVLLIVTAPRRQVADLGPGEYATAVDLILTSERSVLDLPEGAIDNGDGSFTLTVPVRATVSAQPAARCVLPLFDAREVVRDGSTDPALQWSGEIDCAVSGGATLDVRIRGEDPGTSAQLTTDGAAPSRSVTLAEGDPAPTLTLEVDRGAAQRLGEGSHDVGIDLQFRVAPAAAVLDIEDGLPAENGAAAARVIGRVDVIPPAPTPVIELASLALTPDVVAVQTRGTAPTLLQWRDELDYELRDGAQGTLAIEEASLPEGVTAFFEVGGIRLPPPATLAGQQGPIALVVDGTLAAAQMLGAGEHAWAIEVVLDPQGAEVRWPGAAREGSTYRATANAAVLVTETPGVRLWTPAFVPQEVSSVDPDVGMVSITAPVRYSTDDGAHVTLRVDDSGLRSYGDAHARLAVDGEPANGPVVLNGQSVELVITVPRAAFTEKGTYDLPVALVAAGEDVVFTVDDAEVAGTEARLPASVQLDYDIPSGHLDVGAWTPEVMDVASTGTGAASRRWERAIVASGMEDGAQPAVSFVEEPGPVAEVSTIRLYGNDTAAENVLAEGPGDAPVTAAFTPGRERIIVVVEAPEDRLRALGLSDGHRLTGTLTIDPRGAAVDIGGDPAPIPGPKPEETTVRARVYEPFDPLPYLFRGLLGLLALLAVAALIVLRPMLPKDAAVGFGGGIAPLPRRGGTVGGPGADVDIGANGPFGEIRGRFGGRLTGAAKFFPAVPVEYDGDTIAPPKSVNIVPDDTIRGVDSGDEFTYVREQLGDGDGGDGGDGRGDGDGGQF